MVSELSLLVGTDSTWSLRAWICGRLAQLPFETQVVDLTKPDYKSKLLSLSPAGLVPVLSVGDFVRILWDTQRFIQ